MLLTSFTSKNLNLKNRIVMAPLTRCRADNIDKIPTELHAEYYRQRAGAGLIISEGSQVSPMAVGYANTPGIYSKKQVKAWQKVTQSVHVADGKIFIQLWHVGRVSHPSFLNGKLPLAPSAINPNILMRTHLGKEKSVRPKALKTKEVEDIINQFWQGAENALEAGFDGAEIHSSNGYLFHQFFSTCSNQRTDKYGGSIENRSRILFELLEILEKRNLIDKIGIRLNPSAHDYHGIVIDKETIPTFDYIVKQLNNFDIAYLHLSEPFTDVDQVEFAEKEIAKRYRPLSNHSLMINKGFTKKTGDEIINNGLADLVSFGVPFIANPDLPYIFKHGLKLTEADTKTYYSPGAKGYTDYPFAKK